MTRRPRGRRRPSGPSKASPLGGLPVAPAPPRHLRGRGWSQPPTSGAAGAGRGCGNRGGRCARGLARAGRTGRRDVLLAVPHLAKPRCCPGAPDLSSGRAAKDSNAPCPRGRRARRPPGLLSGHVPESPVRREHRYPRASGEESPAPAAPCEVWTVRLGLDLAGRFLLHNESQITASGLRLNFLLQDSVLLSFPTQDGSSVEESETPAGKEERKITSVLPTPESAGFSDRGCFSDRRPAEQGCAQRGSGVAGGGLRPASVLIMVFKVREEPAQLLLGPPQWWCGPLAGRQTPGPPRHTTTLSMDFVAGAIGGVCGVAVGYPLDTVKVKIQTEPKYRGIWHCVWDTYRRERVWGFYRGLSLPVCTVSLVSSVSFGTYRHCLAHICRFRYGSTDIKPAKTDITLSGFASGLVRVFLTSPTEVAKVRLQTQTQQRRPSASWPSAVPPACPAPPASSGPGPKYRGPLHCLATVAREEGLRGLYKGSSALLFRDGHSFATYFLSYTILCEQLTPTGRSQPDVLGVLVAGGCAGVLAWAVATPMDVIKSRLQADGQGRRRYRGLLHCVVSSVREEGPRVLFKGLTLNCCRAFPVNMVVFVTYEAVLGLTRGLST